MWDTYTWFDRLFTSEESVLVTTMPVKPRLPKRPAPSDWPDKNSLNFYEGGGGKPQSGELSLSENFEGTSKFFGILGQATDEFDVSGFTITPDQPRDCKARFVAISAHIHDDKDVSAKDELQISRVGGRLRG